MKAYYLLLLFLLAQSTLAQAPFRFEAEAGVSSLRLSQPYRSGWHVRQQLTAYVRPRLGAALAIGWGGSTNDAVLTSQLNQYGRPDPRALLAFYNRQERMIDLSAVWLPVSTRRHQVKVQAGLSLQRRRELSIDSIIYEQPGTNGYYYALPTYLDQSRVVPMLALGYDLKLSPRWSVGLNAVTYPGDAALTTLGLRTSYRFNISRDSLGIQRGPAEPLTWGIRIAVSRVGTNGGANTTSHNLTRGVGGLWAAYPLSLTWSMRGELTYARRGYRTDGYRTSRLTTYDSLVEADYLELPLLFSHEVAERWHLYAGPYLAFLLQGSSRRDGQAAVRIEPHTNSGLMLGAAYQLGHLGFDLRYQRDILEVSTTPYNNGYHSYQLGLNWQFK